jgi:hypothetical protein
VIQSIRVGPSKGRLPDRGAFQLRPVPFAASCGLRAQRHIAPVGGARESAMRSLVDFASGRAGGYPSGWSANLSNRFDRLASRAGRDRLIAALDVLQRFHTSDGLDDRLIAALGTNVDAPQHLDVRLIAALGLPLDAPQGIDVLTSCDLIP